ncbi:MAG: hypothetical protein HOI95_23270 [Chromatiales bacterium]|jgi:alkanesulfonate monooxygenase SsuD/methylene tetrahydromethanopterin reductase-like flavin-dependent oxidoreductase (luciferase family)|nr:hypothetical protein [Chromatiales bacterium]
MAPTVGYVLAEALFGPIAGPGTLKTLAQCATANGFNSVWFADHVVMPRNTRAWIGEHPRADAPARRQQPRCLQ